MTTVHVSQERGVEFGGTTNADIRGMTDLPMSLLPKARTMDSYSDTPSGLIALLFRWALTATLIGLVIGCGRSDSTLTLQRATAANILEKAAEHQGDEAVLINFWATWCAPCVEEFPMIVALDRRYQAQGLRTYFVSVDWLDETDRVTAFLERQGVNGLSFIKDQKDQPFIDGIAGEWTGAVPFTIIFGKQSGAVVDLWEGKGPEDRFVGAIEAALHH
jgi:thiol-disulfide isomerase/thioredoxin